MKHPDSDHSVSILPPKHKLHQAEEDWNVRFDEPPGACLSGTLGCGLFGLLLLIALLGLCSCNKRADASQFSKEAPATIHLLDTVEVGYSKVYVLKHDNGQMFIMAEGNTSSSPRLHLPRNPIASPSHEHRPTSIHGPLRPSA